MEEFVAVIVVEDINILRGPVGEGKFFSLECFSLIA